MRTIADETALEATPEGVAGNRDYLRSKSDPHALISCRTGEVYARRDGAKWEHPAYVVERDRADRITYKPASAYCDTTRYTPVANSAAA